MWKDTLGVDTVFEEQEFRTYLQSSHDKTQWEVARLSWGADYNDATSFLDVFRVKSPNNAVGYSSTAFDALLDEAAAAADPQVRRDLLEAAERVILNDTPIIPLYFYVSRHLVKPYLRGVEFNPQDRAPSKLISIIAH
jgi:oligopeptide transport system substrate-binding protein